MRWYIFLGAVSCVLAAATDMTCEWAYSCEFETQCCRKDEKPFSVYWYPDLSVGGWPAPGGLGECGDLGQVNETCFTGMSIDYCRCDEGLSCRPAPDNPYGTSNGFFPPVLHTCQPIN